MKIAVMPGDGIGPEVVAQALKALQVVAPQAETQEAPIGEAGIQAHGAPLPERTLDVARKADAILFGAAAASTGITYLPMLVAKQRGYFKDEGLDVTIAAFSGGSKTLEALLGGGSDMVAGAYSNTITMATKGQHLVVVAAQVICPGWIFGVSQKRGSDVKSPKDLKGLRIGVSAPGSSTHIAVNYILHKAGLQPSDVSIIGVGQAAGAVAAVTSASVAHHSIEEET
ncbi:isocitrate/isopropylmalate family dehydrogenase [Caballeronia sp. RCC_10]|jgi:ABC-type nitrate/sulfonate/bicarbonate transport system substrate-binding protein|uniref:isocitrate/isopropylmalate family dehydrogenase n=1 Tax=Caballeronia sp. RCC_10 TaxID=3239227 RepID=UPI00352685E5